MPGPGDRSPRVIGPNAADDRIVDVESVTGEIVPVPRGMLPSLGLQIEQADQAIAQEQTAQAPAQIAQAPTFLQQAANPSMVEPTPGAQIMDFTPPGMTAPAGPPPGSVPEDPRLESVDPSAQFGAEGLRGTAPVRVAMVEQRERAAAEAEARAQAEADAALLDPQAMIAELVTPGTDVGRRREIVEQLGRLDALGFLDQGRGGGGSRVRRTETARFSGPGRAPSEEEAATLAAARAQKAQGEAEELRGAVAGMERAAQLEEDTSKRLGALEGELALREERRRVAERARELEAGRRQREIDRLISDQIQRREDPGRLFAQGQTGNRISTAIGFFLGGLAEGLGSEGAVDQFMGIIDRTIQRDIESQRANIAQGAQGIEQQRGILRDVLSRFGDQEAAEAAARATALADVERQLLRFQHAARSDVQRAQIAEMLGQVRARRAAAVEQATIAGLGTSETVIERREGAGGGGGRRPRLDFSQLAAATPEPEGITDAARQDFEDRLAGAEEAIETIRQVRTAVEEGAAALGPGPLQRLIRAGSEPGAIASALDALGPANPLRSIGSGVESEEGRAAQRAVNALGRLRAAQTKLIAGPGAITEAERAAFDPLTELSEVTSLPELRSTLERMEAEAVRQVQSARRSASDRLLREQDRRRPRIDRAVVRGQGTTEQRAPSFEED